MKLPVYSHAFAPSTGRVLRRSSLLSLGVALESANPTVSGNLGAGSGAWHETAASSPHQEPWYRWNFQTNEFCEPTLNERHPDPFRMARS